MLTGGRIARVTCATHHAAANVSIVEIEASAMGHPDEFSVNGERTGVEGAGTHHHSVARIL